jgi:hypothetical protein
MRDEETLEEEEEKWGLGCRSRLLMWWFIFFNEDGGQAGCAGSNPRARGQGRAAARGGRSLFSLGPCPLFAFSRVSFVYHFTGRRRKKGGTAGPLMSDSTRLQRNSPRRTDMTGSEISPWDESGQRQSVLWMKPCTIRVRHPPHE